MLACGLAGCPSARLAVRLSLAALGCPVGGRSNRVEAFDGDGRAVCCILLAQGTLIRRPLTVLAPDCMNSGAMVVKPLSSGPPSGGAGGWESFEHGRTLKCLQAAVDDGQSTGLRGAVETYISGCSSKLRIDTLDFDHHSPAHQTYNWSLNDHLRQHTVRPPPNFYRPSPHPGETGLRCWLWTIGSRSPIAHNAIDLFQIFYRPTNQAVHLALASAPSLLVLLPTNKHSLLPQLVQSIPPLRILRWQIGPRDRQLKPAPLPLPTPPTAFSTTR